MPHDISISITSVFYLRRYSYKLFEGCNRWTSTSDKRDILSGELNTNDISQMSDFKHWENILLCAFEEFHESWCKAKFLCFHQQTLKGFSPTISPIRVTTRQNCHQGLSLQAHWFRRIKAVLKMTWRSNCCSPVSALLRNSLASQEQEEKCVPSRMAGTWSKIGPGGQWKKLSCELSC